MRYAIGILEIALNLQIALGRMDILMILYFFISVNTLCASNYLYLPQFLSSVSYNFQSTGLLSPWLNLSPGILLCFKQL